MLIAARMLRTLCLIYNTSNMTGVVKQGWEISILSQLRTELMCHLA